MQRAAVVALQTHAASHPVVLAALRALVSLHERTGFRTATHDTLKQQAQRACAATLAAMRVHAGCTEVQLCGLLVLPYMLDRTEAAHVTAAVECGAIEIVVAALRAPSTTDQLVVAGLPLMMLPLAGYHGSNAANIAKAVSAGAFEAVVAALCAHVTDDQITEICCQCLSTWVVGTSAAYAVQAASAGAIEAVLAALEAHGASRFISHFALATLRTMCHIVAGAKRTAGRVGALRIISATMRAHASETRVQGTAAAVISELAQEPDVLASAGATEAIDALAEAARVHPHASAPLENVFTAIRRLCAREDNRQRAWSAGAVDAALESIDAEAPPELLKAAFGMLAGIVSGPNDASVIACVRRGFIGGGALPQRCAAMLQTFACRQRAAARCACCWMALLIRLFTWRTALACSVSWRLQ